MQGYQAPGGYPPQQQQGYGQYPPQGGPMPGQQPSFYPPQGAPPPGQYGASPQHSMVRFAWNTSHCHRDIHYRPSHKDNTVHHRNRATGRHHNKATVYHHHMGKHHLMVHHHQVNTVLRRRSRTTAHLHQAPSKPLQLSATTSRACPKSTQPATVKPSAKP
jgi:hypothetical protein